MKYRNIKLHIIVTLHFAPRNCSLLLCPNAFFVCLFAEKEQQEAIEHIDEVQNEIDR